MDSHLFQYFQGGKLQLVKLRFLQDFYVVCWFDGLQVGGFTDHNANLCEFLYQLLPGSAVTRFAFLVQVGQDGDFLGSNSPCQ
jgi:hypothetical protein